ncbi:VOC family protein [Rossellomorea aquimaris]|uniref:VOC family protein n=1 Tax=Rossellomorea aquimaris TaxID=189382 RepID=UPI001CD7FFE0|nr:VOC family protein [Rossellomorea aquimaris]MCA1055556.1 VOC family protein [Rossellomorea aquimaris]
MGAFIGVMQTNLMVRDIERAKVWYREILQAHIEEDYGTTVLISFGGSSSAPICLIQDGEAAGGQQSSYPVLQISEEHKDAVYEDLRIKGVKLEGNPAHRSHFKFYDCDGNRLEAYCPGIYEES